MESRNSDLETNLNDIEVFIFDEKGLLKGYKKVVGEDAAWDKTAQTIKVKTRTGLSYIYAVVNNGGDRYSMEEINDNGNKIEFTEERAQNKEINFTLDQFKQLSFNREERHIDVASRLAMSGAVNNGNPCSISLNSEGNAYISDITDANLKKIALRRIVSKVTFNFTAAEGVSFIPTKYDIRNIPIKVSVVQGETLSQNTYEEINGQTFGSQTPNSFEAYLPENLQTAKSKDINDWHKRETNTYSENGIKTFNNAPTDGTYIVVYGKFQDKNSKIEGEVNYTIHLGDFTNDLTNFNNKRNYKYTYHIKVLSVNKIIAEAKVESNEEPGAEGFVVNYSPGKAFTLDSHYESCVMRFSFEEIYAMKHNETEAGTKGYIYQVKTHQGQTEHQMITKEEDITNAQLNGVDIDWIEFYQRGEYDADKVKGGTPLSYIQTKEMDMYTIQTLLLHLYDIADEDDAELWTKVIDGKRYLDFTCFIKENYYEDLTWDKYVNVEPRSFYIANNVNVSNDKKSVYADVKYNVSQYSIQTFYNPINSTSLIAYGCETINDEEEIITVNGKEVERGTTMLEGEISTNEEGEITVSNSIGNHTDSDLQDGTYIWDGRYLTKLDMAWTDQKMWNEIKPLENLYHACMARNRDLDRNGKIDDNEIRWYTPSLPQCTGLWIGEEALATNARMYNKVLGDVRTNTFTIENNKITTSQSGLIPGDYMHYYTSTNPRRNFWTEEGMAYGNAVKSIDYVRCVRNLQSVDSSGPKNGVDNDVIADEYYTYKDNTFNLERIAPEALRTGNAGTGELTFHHERSDLNKARIKFEVAETSVLPGHAPNGTKTIDIEEDNIEKTTYPYFSLQTVQTSSGIDSPCYKYNNNGENNPNGTWRIPNQREFALMTLQQLFGSGSQKPYYAARTAYSGQHRFGYRFNGGNMQMIELDKVSLPSHIAKILGIEKTLGNATLDRTNGNDRYRIRCIREK